MALASSVAIPPGGQVALTLGSNAYLAAITLAGQTGISVTAGT